MQKSHSVDNGQVSVSEPDVMADPSTPPLGSKEEADLQQLVAPHTTGRLKLPWALRVQSRTQMLCKWFDIPQSETLLADYVCALKTRVLLQGRLFVFDHYVCFSANVFGYSKKRVIRIPDIVAVRKKKYFRLPNSIELENVNGRRDFFTSFLARDSAYRRIVWLWTQKSPALAEYARLNAIDDDDMYSAIGNHVRHSSEGLPDILGDGHWSDPSRGQQVADDALAVDLAQPLQTHLHRNSPIISEEEDELEGDDGDESDVESGDSSIWAVTEPGAMPARHKDCKLLAVGAVPGSVHDVYNVLLANDSHFLEESLEEQGNKRFHLQPWKRAAHLGHIRDMQFTSPIKGAFANWGVPETRCFVSQRFCRYGDGSLLFESSQTNMDIPYGDCFSVDTRWEMVPAADGRVQIDVYLRVPFSRMCLFKKVCAYCWANASLPCCFASGVRQWTCTRLCTCLSAKGHGQTQYACVMYHHATCSRRADY